MYLAQIYNPPSKLILSPSFNIISKKTKSQNFKLKCVYDLNTIITLLNLSRQLSNLIEHWKQEAVQEHAGNINKTKQNTSGNISVCSLKLDRLWKFLFPSHSDSYVPFLNFVLLEDSRPVLEKWIQSRLLILRSHRITALFFNFLGPERKNSKESSKKQRKSILPQNSRLWMTSDFSFTILHSCKVLIFFF